MNTVPAAELRAWLRRTGRPFPLDAAPAAPRAAAGATIVGIAAAVRSTRELALVSQSIVGGLVADAGFRAVSIEGTTGTGAALDRYLTGGTGDPAGLLRESQGFLHTSEALALVRQLRRHNVTHPDDPVRVVHGAPERPLTSLDAIESHLAAMDLDWHRRTGDKIVHVGGIAHMVVGDPRTVSPNAETQRNAGALLRDALGAGYHAIALTAGSGSIGFGDAPMPLPSPPPSFFEAAFAGLSGGATMLELGADPAPPPAAEHWLRAPLLTRCVGPVYDARDDPAFHLTAGPAREAIDTAVHVERVGPAGYRRPGRTT